MKLVFIKKRNLEFLIMRKFILVILFLVCVNVCFSQNPEIPTTTRTSYVPAAPSVSSLMHFAEIPVNEFTGVPEVSENIFTSKTISNKIDFNISYDIITVSVYELSVKQL